MTRARMQGRLELDQALHAALIEHARSDFPYEVCGLLAGAHGRPERQYRIANAARSLTYYSMDPKALLHAMNEIDDDGLELLAIYHSHTHTEAFPSPTDVELAFYPEAVYLIVSLQSEPPVLRGFDIVEGTITERMLFVDGVEAAAGSR